LGSAGSLASFNDILFPRSRRLNHLVDCAVSFFQKPFTEWHGALENHERFLVSKQAGIAAMRRNESFARVNGLIHFST